jgi:AraC-like DNA-binding protein
MSRDAAPPVSLLKFPGLCSAREVIAPHHATQSFLSHNDVAFNYLERGRMRVLMATGFRYEHEAGRLAVFWGAVPHKMETYEPGSIGHSVVLPLGTFLRYSIPGDFVRQLTRGRVYFEPDDAESAIDLALLKRWHRDIASGDADARAIVLLELEARLRRLARACPTSPRKLARLTPQGAGQQAERMLLLVAAHFREHLTVADVAAAVDLHPDYAGQLFYRRMGMPLRDYITECRVLHAKAMLATTNAKLLEVMRDSGFGSVSQFHAIFKRHCGCTPRAYRMNVKITPDDPGASSPQKRKRGSR